MRQQLLAIFICLMKQYLSNTNLGNVMPPPHDRSRTGLPNFLGQKFQCHMIQPELSAFFPQEKGPHPGQRQTGAGTSPPRAGSFAFPVTPGPFYRALDFVNSSIYSQTAFSGRPFLINMISVFSVRCGVPGNIPIAPARSYSLRKKRAPIFWAAERSQL